MAYWCKNVNKNGRLLSKSSICITRTISANDQL